MLRAFYAVNFLWTKRVSEDLILKSDTEYCKAKVQLAFYIIASELSLLYRDLL
ncbi:protein of unknown function [Shewanella benthica]|uniref:Uncharacterized protein n=1 Tax=Shewanella benthica TaxID=43661 RepID=A0A330MA56_9GAMM|nr:protein of unknown function [Shewanella benthica]